MLQHTLVVKVKAKSRRLRAQRIRRRKEVAEERTGRRVMEAELRTLRPDPTPPSRICTNPRCGRPFTGKSPGQGTCSTTCREIVVAGLFLVKV